MSGIIEVENLSFGYTQNTILESLNFEVVKGAFVGIAGPNGAGKTTLLNLLCGLLKPNTGSIKIDSASTESYSVKKLARKISIVRQEFIPAFDFTVIETVSMARAPYLDIFGFESQEDKDTVAEALEMTDTAQLASRPLAQLSGGERQRVFIARALAQNTTILLLDEPTTYLDLRHQVEIYDLLKTMQLEKQKTIVVVTHDINLAAQYCEQTLLLGADCTYHYGKTKEILYPEQIEQVFGIRTLVCNIGQEKFFVPLGKFAKDNQGNNTNPNSIQPK